VFERKEKGGQRTRGRGAGSLRRRRPSQALGIEGTVNGQVAFAVRGRSSGRGSAANWPDQVANSTRRVHGGVICTRNERPEGRGGPYAYETNILKGGGGHMHAKQTP